MINVTFEYRFLGFKRYLKRQVPTSFQEMTQEKFTSLVRMTEGVITPVEFYCKFFGISTSIYSKLDRYQLYKLTEAIRVDGKSTECFIVKSIEGLVSPADRLSNMSFQQFMTVDQHFGWYNYTEKRKYLDRMMAALYVHEGKDFFSSDWNERIRIFSKMEKKELYAAVVNWMLIKNWLGEVYPSLFAGGSAPSYTAKGNKKPKPGNWLEIFDAVVGDNLHLIDEYKHMPCMDAMRYINNKIKKERFKGRKS